MDTDELSKFYDQVTLWPKNQYELDALAERVGVLLNIDYVVIIPPGQKGEVGIRATGMGPIQTTHRSGFMEFIREHLKPLEEKNRQIHSVDTFRKGIYWPNSSSIQQITLFRIKKDSSQSEKEFGALVLGTSKRLDPSVELQSLAVARLLSDLLKIADLDQSLQVRTQFLSIASHELKTPLTSIYGVLQLQERMLRQKKETATLPDQERHHHFLKMVIRQVERLNELIDGLLDVSRIQSGRFLVEPSETDVGNLLKESVLSRLTLIAQEAGVRLQVDSPEQYFARVDPVRMEEVVSNLVMNAIRFSPEGGVVWIRLRGEESSFRLTIRDQGPSIPIEDRERIFQPFERAQRTSRMGGLGLGLFIARQIAQLHGGNVSLIESVPGKGNVFEAYFPTQHISEVRAQ